jgi:chromosome segregation ATPase
VARREEILTNLETDRKNKQQTLSQIEEEAKSVKDNLQSQQDESGKLRNEWRTLFDERLSLEREKAANASTISLCEQILKETAIIDAIIQNTSVKPNRLTIENSQFRLLKSENLKGMVQNSNEQLSKLKAQISGNEKKTQELEETSEKVNNQVLDSRIKLALLQYRIETAKTNLEELERGLVDAKAGVEESTKKAEQTGARIAVIKDPGEIIDDIRVTEGHLAALSDISEDIERMYESYSKLYLELKEKAQLVAENREKTLEEVKTRMQSWRTVIQNLLDRVNLEYQKTLAQAQAVGQVRLANENEIEAAGLEIMVGFKGGKPVPLDAYTQSGGERTTAIMSFLLALQQHVRSLFRAVDEYDIHMDPKNRELIARMLISAVDDSGAQYVIITPSQIPFAKEDVNIITVQNIDGKSIIREVA